MGWFSKKEEEEAIKRPPQAGVGDARVRPPDLSTELRPSERAFLVACCDPKTPAVVTWVDLGIVRRAVLDKVHAEQIRLWITDQGPVRHAFRPRAQCVVSFYTHDRLVTFVAYEEPVERPRSPDELLLTMPTQLAVEGRTRYRIPVHAGAGLKVTLLCPTGRRLQAEALDISVAGIMFRFAGGGDPGVCGDQLFGLELALGDMTCQVPVSVRHRADDPAGPRFGCIFHTEANGYEYAREKDLGEMVLALERYWARNRPR